MGSTVQGDGMAPGSTAPPAPIFSNLRVAALIDTAIVSGPGRQLAALAVCLRESGVTLRVFMFQRAGRPPSPYIAYLARAGIEHVILPDRGPFDISPLIALVRSLREWQPDIVQSHNYRTTVMAFLMRLGRPAWPWIAFFHGSTSEDWKVRLYNRIDRALLPRADCLVVMSDRHRAEFSATRRRVEVIHNAVVPLPVEAAPVDFRHVSDRGAALVGVIGRLSPEKGVDVLLRAAALLPRGTVCLVIAGDGPQRDALERQAAEAGLADSVHFLGTVGDVGSLYPQLDLVVLPSRSEGLPNVLLEALRADIPVVATSVGAVTEVLHDRAAGEVVPPDDPAALARGIVRALTVGRSNEAACARAAAAERFSLEHRVDRHLSLYAELRPDRLAGDRHS
jgi:glycosyltransferase involved in cell wall biosynthesis